VPARTARAVQSVPAADAARDQLERILGSQTFRQVDRLKRFLAFVVDESLQGRGDQLKEYVIGVAVFDKDTSFDPRADPIVRVQARRLRARLVRYYRDEGSQDAIVIELRKGSYAPLLRARGPAPLARRSLGVMLASANTIAVKTFADHSAGGVLGYFCDGLTEEVVHRLARIEALRVVADADGSAGGPPPAMIVTGGVRASGTRLRVTAHLIDGLTQSYFWSETIDTNLDDEFAAHEAVASAVVHNLEPRLRDAEGRRGGRRPAENLAARNLYLQGRYHLNQRTDAGLHKAVEFFEKALAEDTQSALAQSGLADAHALLAHYGVVQPALAWTKAASCAAAAVMLDNNSAEAHTSFAHVKATQDWDWQGAEREFQLAIALDPLYPTARHWYAMSCLVPLGRLEEAVELVQTAQALDPVSPILARDLALLHAYRGDFDSALNQCDDTIEMNPHFSPGYWALGIVQEQRRDLEEAIAAFQRAIALSPDNPRMHAGLGRVLALAGRRDRARNTIERLHELARERYVSPFEFAIVEFARGHVDTGFEWLGRACDERAFDVLALRVDPRLSGIHDDPRFDALLSKASLDS
jgi:TolB-like protein/Flp pilus assembly protein TadD